MTKWLRLGVMLASRRLLRDGPSTGKHDTPNPEGYVSDFAQRH